MIIAGLRRLRPRRRLGWLWIIITAGTLVNGLRLRARVSALQEMADDAPPTTAAVDPDHVFLTATGVELDDATRSAASRYARRHHLDVLDLVPGDLGSDQVLDLARQVDPATYASSPLAVDAGLGKPPWCIGRCSSGRASVRPISSTRSATFGSPAS